MKLKALFFILFFTFFSAAVWSQQISHAPNETLDSLKNTLKSASHDSTRCNSLYALIEAEEDEAIWPSYNNELKKICEKNLKITSVGGPLYRFYTKQLAAAINNEAYLANIRGNIPAALAAYKQSILLDEQIGNKAGLAYSLNNIASLYQYQGEIKKALDCYFKSLELHKEAKDELGIAESLNNIGLVYNDQGDVPNALDYYNQSLKIQEKIKDKKGLGTTLNNIGALYQHQGDLNKALTYFTRSLKLEEETQNLEAAAGALHNMALIYKKQHNTAKALEYLNKSFKLAQETKNLPGIAHCYNSYGVIYNDEGDINKALENWHKSLSIWEKLNDKQGMALVANHMASALYMSGKSEEAKKYGELCLKLAKELEFPENIKDASSTLSAIYAKEGNWKKAYEMQVLFKAMNDSVRSEAGRKAYLQKSFQFEYEKKAAADSIKAVEQRKVFDAQIQQQKTQGFALVIVITLIALFALFMYNRFRVTRKQKHIIEQKEKETQQQKQLIEEKHKEISDSINYAERIQRSFLASELLLDQYLKDYFILFKPKATVSGDFYWAAKLTNDHFAFVVADSTGHGVPGAIMSLLNITSLEKAIEQQSDPAQILNHTRKTIIERLKNDGSAEGGKDGMDCSLLVFDFKNAQLLMASAHNPVWIIRSENNKAELIEMAADKMPVGKHDHDAKTFSTQKMDLNKGDMIYLLSDGFADQFGGPKGKKFMYKQLKELLITISGKNPAQQKELLTEALRAWTGELEQVDDITIAGIRIS